MDILINIAVGIATAVVVMFILFLAWETLKEDE